MDNTTYVVTDIYCRLINEMDNGNNPTSSRVSFTPNLETSSSPLRRSRADTMPSQSSAFPYATDIFSNLTLNTATTNNVGLISRHRSGSVTLPNEEDEEANRFSQTPFYSPYDPSSPIDENASNTIASTLASLGLDDEENNTPNYHEGRARSFTMTGNDMRLTNGNFSPFSPHTRSSVLHRPRAISLGMVDAAFSPFDMSAAKPASRFNNTPLRSSRSSNNLVDLNDSMHEEDLSYGVSFYIYIFFRAIF
jgi:hypothetical protein